MSVLAAPNRKGLKSGVNVLVQRQKPGLRDSLLLEGVLVNGNSRFPIVCDLEWRDGS